MNESHSLPPQQGHEQGAAGSSPAEALPTRSVNLQDIQATDIVLRFRFDPRNQETFLARALQLIAANEMLVLLSLLKYRVSTTAQRKDIPLLVILLLARAYSSINEHKLAAEILQLYLDDDAYIAARAQVEDFPTPFTCKLVLLLPYIIETHLLCGIGHPLTFTKSLFDAKDKGFLEKFSILFLCITDIFKLYGGAKTLLEDDKLFARVVNDVATVHNLFSTRISASLGQAGGPRGVEFLRHKIYSIRRHLGILIPAINASAFSSVSLVAKCILCFIELIKEYTYILKEGIVEQVFGKDTPQKVQDELTQLLGKSHILVLKSMTIYAEQRVTAGTDTFASASATDTLTPTGSPSTSDPRHVVTVGVPQLAPHDVNTPSASTPVHATTRLRKVAELLADGTGSRPHSTRSTQSFDSFRSSNSLGSRMTPARPSLGPSGVNGFTEFMRPDSIPTTNLDIRLRSFFIGKTSLDLVSPRVRPEAAKIKVPGSRNLNTNTSAAKEIGSESRHSISTPHEQFMSSEVESSSRVSVSSVVREKLDKSMTEVQTVRVVTAAEALEYWYEKTMQSKITFQVVLNLANILKINQFNNIIGYDETIYFLAMMLSDFESYVSTIHSLSDFLVLVFEMVRLLMAISDHLVQRYSTVAYIIYSYSIRIANIYCDIERKMKLQFNMEEQYKGYLDPLREVIRELSVIFGSQKLKERYCIDIAYENGDTFFIEIVDSNLMHAICLEYNYSISEFCRLAARRIAIIELTLSLALFNAKLYLDAVLWLERATINCDQLEDAWILLARAYLNIGEKEKSIKAASMCYRLNPSNLQAKKYCEGAVAELEVHVKYLNPP